MNKIVAGIGLIVVILIAAGAFWLFSVPSATAAILYVDEGTVEVDTGAGWAQGQDEMELPVGAKVRTGAGAASVVMLEGEVMHIQPNTEVTLSEINDQKIRITQALGETWHKVTKISGISTYEVETPNTVATVRGTEFFVKSDEEDEVAVEEGEIEIGFVKTPSKKLTVGPKRKIRMQAKLDKMIEEVMDEDPRAAKFREKYIKHLKQMRMSEIKKQSVLMQIAKKRYGVTDEKVQQYLEDVDEGRQDEEKAYNAVPSPLKKKVERAYKITKFIKEAKRAETTAKELRERTIPKITEQEKAQISEAPVQKEALTREQVETIKFPEDTPESIDKLTAAIEQQ